ncbi:MAG: hypothetical protein Q9217_005683 [Psora testacea]
MDSSGLQGNFPLARVKRDQKESTRVQVGIGAGLGKAGGSVPHEALWDENGIRIGQCKADAKGHLKAGITNDITGEHKQNGYEEATPHYLQLTALEGDAVCVAMVAVSGNGVNWGWKSTPSCIWIDADHTKDIRAQGFSLHMLDFAATEGRKLQLEEQLDTTCNSVPRMAFWYDRLPDNIPPFFDPPLTYTSDGADVDTKCIVNLKNNLYPAEPRPRNTHGVLPSVMPTSIPSVSLSVTFLCIAQRKCSECESYWFTLDLQAVFSIAILALHRKHHDLIVDHENVGFYLGDGREDSELDITALTLHSDKTGSRLCQLEKVTKGCVILEFVLAVFATVTAFWALQGEREKWRTVIEMKNLRHRRFEEEENNPERFDHGITNTIFAQRIAQIRHGEFRVGFIAPMMTKRISEKMVNGILDDSDLKRIIIRTSHSLQEDFQLLKEFIEVDMFKLLFEAAATFLGYDQALFRLFGKDEETLAPKDNAPHLMVIAAYLSKTRVVRSLLAQGAISNDLSYHFGLALPAAAGRAHVGVVKLLLENGADINHPNYADPPTLHGQYASTAIAAASQRGTRKRYTAVVATRVQPRNVWNGV